MDRKLEKQYKETFGDEYIEGFKSTPKDNSIARKAVLPIVAKWFNSFGDFITEKFDNAIKSMPKTEIPDEMKVSGEVSVKDFRELIDKFNQLSKEVKNIKAPIVNVEKGKTVVEIKELAEIKTAMKAMIDKMVELGAIEKVELSNLPTQDFLNEKNQKESGVPVIVKNWKLATGGGGGSSTEKISSDTYWLREEYTYTTVSGSQVPSKLIRWSDNLKVTTNYEYDGNANPIVKTRLTEPVSGAGQDE